MKFTISLIGALLTLGASSVIAAPISNATDESVLLKRALATVYTKCSKANTVALTFDDGPWIYEKDVVNALSNAGVKGTFFVNGNNYDCIYNSARRDSLKYAYSKGHQIGSHTWAHLHLSKQSNSKINDEMAKVETALQRILGVKPAFTRPPYGEYNNNVRTVAAQRGQKLVNWDFDSGDSVGKTASQSKNSYKALAAKHPNNILALNHEVYASTAHDVLPYAINLLKGKGYKLVTVAECLGQSPYLSVGSPGTFDSKTWHC